MQLTGREDVAMSLVDQVRKLEQQVVERLKELEPLTREYDQLRKVAQRLGLKYSPGSTEAGDAATAPKSARRAGKRAAAAKRAPRTPTKAKAARGVAAKPTAKPRGTRSSTATQTSASARATGASETVAAARPRKRAATSRQRPSGRRPAARPGQRHDDVLGLVRENPGITVREIGERLGVDSTGLYRVVTRLTNEGRVRKDGAQLQPVDSTTATAPTPQATGVSAQQTPATAADETPEATRPATSRASTTGAATAPSADT
jgi:Winged helix-turn-helix DNA-binding